MEAGIKATSQFEEYNEYGITVLADTKASCPRKSPLYLSKELSFVRFDLLLHLQFIKNF